MARKSSAAGKIILSGEYAVLFGHKAIALPSKERIDVMFEEDKKKSDIEISWEADPEWISYVQDIINHCIVTSSIPPGTLIIKNAIPLGKGMGSSTALIIAIAKILLGPDCKEEAESIEKALYPDRSGLDFAVIWNETPILYQKEKDIQGIEIDETILSRSFLIDTGTPDQTTSELVASIKEREETRKEPLEIIGTCSDRIRDGEDIEKVMRDHHRAQVSLGVVPESVAIFIRNIEESGGAAKVIGAGAKTGGGGIVFALHPHEAQLQELAEKGGFKVL